MKSESTQKRRDVEVLVMTEMIEKPVALTKISITLMNLKKKKIVTEVVNTTKNRRTEAISITIRINVNVVEMLY